MTDAPGRRRLRDRLGYQVAFVLAVLLLPLTVISVGRSRDLLLETRARSEAALIGETMREVSGELRLIQEARGTAKAAAALIPDLHDNPALCSTILRSIAESRAGIDRIDFVGPDLKSRCNSRGRDADYSHDRIVQRAMTSGIAEYDVSGNLSDNGEAMLLLSEPVHDAAGNRIGTVGVGVSQASLRAQADTGMISHQPLTVIIFHKTGTVLSTSRELADLAEALPNGRSLDSLATRDPVAFSELSGRSEQRVYSVVPLVPDKLFALGSWPPDESQSLLVPSALAPAVMPILMWLGSLIVAWLTVERLVIRHIRKLSRSLISFAGGNRRVGDIDVTGAPIEIREMADAYESMTDTILHDEAELEDMVHKQEVLLREVHHRVKNNLQLIASILNLQMRRTQSDEARLQMKRVQERVMNLATIHRELYQTVGVTDIDTRELLGSIVRQVLAMNDAPSRGMTLTTAFDEILLVPDQAVPLALFLAEAVTSAMKHAPRPAELSVTLNRSGDNMAVLTVANSMTPVASTDEISGFGSQLISAFALQLGGRVERVAANGVYVLTLTFAMRPLSEAEERFAARPQA